MVPFVFCMPFSSDLSVEMHYTFANNASAAVQNVTVLTQEQEGQRAGMLTLVGFLFGMTSLVSVTTFSTSFMLINNSCSNDDRGAVNGLAMTIASVTKAVGPVVGSSILAWSFQHGRHIAWIFGHAFNFWLVSLLWVVLGCVSYKVLFQYKLDVHYQAMGNEINFHTVASRGGGGGGGGEREEESGGGDIVAELDESSWADI